MGACASSYRPQNSAVVEMDLGLYREVLKCPNGHWLAVYNTQKCSKCLQREVAKNATVSCVDCDFGLCEDCFSRKFSLWEKKALKLNPEQAEQLLKSLKQQIQGYRKLISNSQEHPRFAQFIEVHHERSTNFDKKPSFRSSLDIRISKIAKLCQQVYKKKTTAVAVA